MFGVVPKSLWSRTVPSDESNRIRLGLNSLLIESGRESVLIETGIGDKLDEKALRIYCVDRPRTLVDELKGLGLEPEDINKVILTHLHFDHAGGATTFDGLGQLVPTYPNATYFVQRTEWEDALAPDPRSKAGYSKDNFLPLKEKGKIELIDGDTEIVTGINTLVTGGHTRGHQAVLIEGGDGRRMIYWSDLMPTTAHIKVTYLMSYDLYPLQAMAMKEELLSKALSGGWASAWVHDPEIIVGYIEQKGHEFKACRMETGIAAGGNA
jgi:glyoxylase-like metal-dependent hydrolase (beta-lactamase superfamily II)